MNQFQSKQTMKNKKKSGFLNRIAYSFHARKKLKCKRKADDIINTCIIHTNNNANLYTNISLCIHSECNFYYVNHDKRQYIYPNTLLGEKFRKKNHTFFKTVYNEFFSYTFILGRTLGQAVMDNTTKPIVTKININVPNFKEYIEPSLICIPCDMFGLIPNDAYLETVNNNFTTVIENWSEFISKKEVQINKQPDTNKKYLINLLSKEI